MAELADYKVTFSRDQFFGLWSWTATTPDERQLAAIVAWGFVDRDRAEADALRRIEIDRARFSVSGAELAERVRSSSATR